MSLLLHRIKKKEATFELFTKQFNASIHPGSRHEGFLQEHRSLWSPFLSTKAKVSDGNIVDATVLNRSRTTHRTTNNRLFYVDND